MTNLDIQAWKWAKSKIGHAYVFGAWGKPCTVNLRKEAMKNRPEYSQRIIDNCDILSERRSTCDGCKWSNKEAYDCRGLTNALVKTITGKGLAGGGATSQWKNENNWVEKGLFEDRPMDRVVICFQDKNGVKEHTGICLGNEIIHSSGHKNGVISSPVPRKMTHYAIPRGFDKDVASSIYSTDPWLIRVKDYGQKVVILQEGLIKAGYPLPKYGADGKFGKETQDAIVAFQKEYGLPEDGAWDSECNNKLEEILAVIDEPLPIEPPKKELSVDEKIDMLWRAVFGE